MPEDKRPPQREQGNKQLTEQPEADQQSQEPGFTQKRNQGEQKEDPLAS